MPINPVLVLPKEGLYSKYGFNDGDMPDQVAAWLEYNGYESEAVDWHETLFNLVEAYLLPEVTLHPGTKLVKMGTAHNPARVLDEEGLDVYDASRSDYSFGVKVDLSSAKARSFFVFTKEEPWEMLPEEDAPETTDEQLRYLAKAYDLIDEVRLSVEPYSVVYNNLTSVLRVLQRHV